MQLSTISLDLTRCATPFYPGSLFTGGAKGVIYDPSDLSTLFQDAAGTIPANIGDPVGLMKDKSGNGLHMQQATAGARPTLAQSGGRYYLSFNGTSQCMATTSNCDLSATSALVFGAAAVTTGNVGGVLLELSPNTNTNIKSCFIANPDSASNNATAMFRGNNGLNGARYLNANINTVLADCDFSRAGAEYVTTINGATRTPILTWDNDNSGNFGSYPLFLGARNQNASYWNGNFYGAVLAGISPTANQRAGLEQWLASK